MANSVDQDQTAPNITGKFKHTSKKCRPRTDCSYRSSNQDQTAPIGAVWFGSTLFACILKFASNVRQLFAADDFSRQHFQMHLRVKTGSDFSMDKMESTLQCIFQPYFEPNFEEGRSYLGSLNYYIFVGQGVPTECVVQ